jgi:uncharacterized repeat protein (TIGR01451 family)
VVTDVLSSALAYVSSTSATGTVAVSGQTVTWNIPELAPSGKGSTATLSIVVSVNTTRHVSNTATFTQTTPNGSGGTSGSSNTVTLRPTYSVLRLVKTVSNPRPQPGTHDTYAITVSNEGPDTASKVLVTDPLPAGVTFVSAAVSEGTVSESSTGSTTTVTWRVGSLADGASAVLHIVVTVTAQTGSVMNTATATDTSYDPSGQMKTASAVATILPPVAVPPTNTGEPWSGYAYWLIVSALGASGLAIFESSRRRRRRYRGTVEP